MKGYAEREVFSRWQLALHRRACALVSGTPTYERPRGREWVRCHELARAVGKVLGLAVIDGWYGFVEHSWLWTQKASRRSDDPFGPLPDILDVYVPGHVPQVQLIHSSGSLLLQYRPGTPRTDIRDDVVARLVAVMRTRKKRS